MSTVFETEDLRISYNGDAALRGVSVSLERGSVIGIAGASGSGKTTLLHAAFGSLGQGCTVEGGSVRLAGRDIFAMDGKERRVYVGSVAGLVPQNPQHSFSPVRTIGRQLEEEACLKGDFSREEAHASAADLLGRLGFPSPEEVLTRYPFELSGGMAQRASVGMALIGSPEVIFADEPTSALDTISQAQVVEELLKVNRDMGVSLVVVSHNIAVLAYISDYLYVMKEGVVVEEGPARQIVESPVHSYTQKLVAAVPRFGGKR